MGTEPLGAANPNIKRLRRLGRRSSRSGDGSFLVEGPVLVREAQRAGVVFDAVYVDESRPELAERVDGGVVRVATGVLAKVLPTVTPQPLVGVAPATLARQLDDVAAAASQRGRPTLVLCDVADPGNVGTMVRAAEASGCGAVAFVGSGVDPYSPKVVRASAGSLFRVPFAVAPDVGGALVALAEAGIVTAAAVARGGVAHLDAPLDGPVAIVVGNEAHGLDDETVASCDVAVTITMDGPTESLNVAMAATVLCFEAMRQRATARHRSAGSASQ